MRTKTERLLLLNITAVLLSILPLLWLDPLNENYSTLSLDRKGHLYLLFMCLINGIVLALEQPKDRFMIFLAVMVSVLIPHHVPYDLQGNLHLLAAVAGAFFIHYLTFRNIFYLNDPFLFRVFYFDIAVNTVIYLYVRKISLLSEIIMIVTVLYLNYRAYKKRRHQ